MKRILIIEDNKKIRGELSIFLSKNGYQCIAPENFENVVQKILAQEPHLVLLDINLPAADGYHICRELRKSSDVPVIVVTSRDTEMDELTAMNLGADDFVTKPYNLQILLMRIASVLKRSYHFASGGRLFNGNGPAGILRRLGRAGCADCGNIFGCARGFARDRFPQKKGIL